jgi:hypothetical protein
VSSNFYSVHCDLDVPTDSSFDDSESGSSSTSSTTT